MSLDNQIIADLPKRAIEVRLQTEDTRIAAFLKGYFKALYEVRSIKNLYEVDENSTYSWRLSFNGVSFHQGLQFAISPLEDIQKYLTGDIIKEINNPNFSLSINELPIYVTN